jgi:hypothetical protein
MAEASLKTWRYDTFWKPSYRWKISAVNGNLKMGCEGTDWIQLAGSYEHGYEP